MRTLQRNKRKLWYSLYEGEETVYVYDADDNKIVDFVDSEGTVHYKIKDVRPYYSTPIAFFGNIAFSGGESSDTEYGVDMSSYSAVLIVGKGLLPIDETSLIWYENEPKTDTITVSDADYKVVKKNSSLNVDKYVLDKVVNQNG